MINTKQIDSLFDYCRKQNVQYYDVQTELVDHMSEWIEQSQNSNGDSFETAFEKMKTEFSQNDFQEMINSKSRSVSQMALRNCLKEFYSFFSWPKILISSSLVLIVILINQFADLTKFPAASINLFNIINLSLITGTRKSIYHNRFEKVLKLISSRQIKRLQLLLLSPSLIYLFISIFSMGNILLPIEIYKGALFLFPFLLLVSLAWRAASIAANEKIRHDYPKAFILR
jgi:hypothetical protein